MSSKRLGKRVDASFVGTIGSGCGMKRLFTFALWFLSAGFAVAASTLAAGANWTRMRDGYSGLYLQALIPSTLEQSVVRWKSGDNPDWSRSSFDDSSWESA